jgi:hypothetical protein
MSLMAVGSQFWWRVAPEQKHVDADGGQIVVQRIVRVRNRYSINPTSADKARALEITFERWEKEAPPRYIAISFKVDWPVFYCPGLVFAADQLIQAGKFERVGHGLQFVKQHAMIFETKQDVYRLEEQLKRLAKEIPGTEYAGHLGKGKRQVRIYLRKRDQMASCKLRFPKAKPFHPPRWRVLKPLVVRLTSAEVKALLWLRVSTPEIEPAPMGVARTLSRLAKCAALVTRKGKKSVGSQHRLTPLGIKVRSRILSLGLCTEILPLVKAARTVVLSKPFLS